MRVTFASILALASIPLLATAAVPSNHTIQHRFLPHPRPSTIDSSWSELGTIQLDFGGAGLEASLEKSLSRDAQVDDGRGWYQVGLADAHGKVSHVSSVRSCYTAAPQIYRFVLSLSTNIPDATVTGLHLDLGNVRRDGKCPESWYKSGDRLFLPNVINSEVVLKVPQRAKQINLAPPPAVDPSTGKAAEPVPEKSFLQKYWLPLLGVGFFVISQMAPEPPQKGAGGQAAS